MNSRKELVNYLFFGGLTTVVNILAYFVISLVYGGPYKVIVANIIAWIVAVLFAYITNRKFVFQSENKEKRTIIFEFGAFMAARVLSLVFETALLLILVDIMYMNALISKIFTNIVVIIFNYYASKLFIFKKQQFKVMQEE